MKSSQAFSGFTEREMRATSLPGSFFSDLLPSIDHLGELKLTLYAFWALGKKEAPFEYLVKSEMLSDEILLTALRQPSMTDEEALEEALERSVSRGSLLNASLTFPDGPEMFYFLNTEKGRAAIQAIEGGEWTPSGSAGKPIQLKIERPNLFTLYEQNIGPLTPMIADTLRDAETSYPESWIEEAIQIAVENNVRKWSYINAILEGWQARGKDAREDRGDTEKARRQYFKGWLGEE